ncbi:hypothetical protein CYY_005331 [Polysphondylium violaceum]|uniref:EGF-like domain-containing protein n=1 Tax=Polysphondylium violaceum TaxID=133409 RepID=A0A8J4Q3C5_9MYCE|nr:hypothetical protein CYY_005331 [Polysphondylium violaceum]
MKCFILHWFMFSFLCFSVLNGAITVSRLSQPTNFDEYGFNQCVYNYSFRLYSADNPIPVLYNPLDTFTIKKTDPAFNEYDIIFNRKYGESGSLLLTATNNIGDFRNASNLLNRFDCVEAPNFSIDLKESLKYSNIFNNYYFLLRIYNKLDRFLPNKLNGYISLDTQYFTQRAIYPIGYQLYQIFYELNPEAIKTTRLGAIFNFTFIQSPTITRNITLTPPFPQTPFTGEYGSMVGSTTSRLYTANLYSMSSNINGNVFLLYNGTKTYNMRLVQGNIINGQYLFYINLLNIYNAVNTNFNQEILVLSNPTRSLGTNGVSLLKQAAITSSSNSITFLNSTTDALITYVTYIYATSTPRTDVTHRTSFLTTPVRDVKYMIFPYGYISGSMTQGYSIKAAYAASIFVNDASMIIELSSKPSVTNTLAAPSVPGSYGQTQEFLGIYDRKVLYRLSCSYKTPVFRVTKYVNPMLDQLNPIIASGSNFVAGTPENPVFEFSHPFEFDITDGIIIQDLEGSTYYTNFYFTPGNVLKLPYKYALIEDFIEIFFEYNNVTVGGLQSPFKNRVFIKFTSDNLFLALEFTRHINSLQFQNSTYYAEYDNTLGYYVADFEIEPNRVSGPISYFLRSQNFSVSSEVLSYYDHRATLVVHSDNADELPPFVTKVEHLPSSSVSLVGASTDPTLTFKITISDPINGLKNGTVWIASNIDPYGYNFTITPDMADNKDPYEGVYSLSFKVPKNSPSQQYSIKDIILYDNSNWRSSFFYPYMNPFFNESVNVNLVLTNTGTVETIPPFLQTFSIATSSPVDVSSQNRQVQIDFRVSDSGGSGVHLLRNPIIYTTELYFGRQLAFTTELVDIGFTNPTTATSLNFLSYTRIVFPMAVIDKPFKVRVTKDASKVSNIFLINPITKPSVLPPITPPPTNPPNTPEPSSSSSISTSSSASSSLSSSPSSSTSSHSKESSASQHPATPTPNIVNKCPGTPEPCGGDKRGNCVNSVCQCIFPYTTKDCSSEIIIVPQPKPDPSKPVINNTIDQPGSNGAYKYLINIDSLRELNSENQPIYTFPFAITQINVTMEWFEENKDIEFANQILSMKPSSMKYLISMDSYPFSSQLNTLQLLMLAKIESSEKDQCSSMEKGDTSEQDDYIQLQVDNHSLYGRFIKRAIIDGKVRQITNSFYQQKTSNSQSSSLISMNVGYYSKSLVMDPDFSVLLDNRPSSEKDGRVCSTSKKKLSTPQIVGIVIGSVAFAIIIVVSVSYSIYKKRQQAHLVDKLNISMKSMS